MTDLEKSVESLHEKIDELNNKVSTLPYRIKMLERITFGFCKLVLVAFVVSLIFLVMPKKQNVSANTPAKVVNKKVIAG